MPAADLLRERRVAPSILSADFARLGAQVEEVMAAGARVVHVDVMDGHFVPPITIGPLVVEGLAAPVRAGGGILDVHLMIDRPERHVADFVSAGADIVSIHQEATPHVHRTLQAVREGGALAGLALNPATPAAVLSEVTELVDVALCMSVNPGWGGQPFIPTSAEKIRRMHQLAGSVATIEVDGGIDERSARPCAEAGAGLFVAGSAIFRAPEPAEAYARIAAAAGAQ